MTNKGFTTQLIHADRQLNTIEHGGVHTSTTQSVLFNFDRAQDLIDVFQGKQAGHVYSRSSSGAVTALQNMLNQLEGGVGALCFSTGMAAIASTLFSLIRAGDHIIVSRFLFGNSRSFMNTLADLGVQISFVDVTDVRCIEALYQPNTKMVFCETIANPVTQVSDCEAIGRFCQEKNIVFMLDTTMTPCYIFDAKKVHASLLVSSLTKYVGGHGNVLGGAVVDSGLYDWQTFSNIHAEYRVADTSQWGLTQIKKRGLRDIGATLSPDSASRLSIGLETLALRMSRACDNALQLATWLNSHEKVDKVYYPGLADHPQHFIARSLFSEFGAILSIELAPDADPCVFLDRLQLVLCATHLGDTRTLALPVASTIYYENGPDGRADMGIAENLIRISVGIEDIDDLIADFEQGLNAQ
ncbi:cystathionine gamma-synthase family protein [Alteromonas oceanisediminis]|uniref:cystathionine gamma-synthase family protein n=1 Tax=Alteromonas oceanisediminis TaxID=2836180 RepID=UPI001BD9B4FB|nr:cystathionine gamma-synthase family protein [Alteromonas oceanisediminis]MBT0586385.1 cystathionine gamma-synthase family protein [Alteromonas oceanisediminis]